MEARQVRAELEFLIVAAPDMLHFGPDERRREQPNSGCSPQVPGWADRSDRAVKRHHGHWVRLIPDIGT